MQKRDAVIRTRRAHPDLVRIVLGGAALAVAYFTVPVSIAGLGAIGQLIASAVAIIVLGFAVVRVVQGGATLSRLVMILMVVVTVFALVFFTVATNDPGQFVGMVTRIDAFYFTLTTMTTTGYGDVHAVGQLARALVSATFVFDVIFLALLAAEVSRSIRRAGEAR